MASLKPFKFIFPFIFGVFLIHPSFEAPEDTGLCGQARADHSKTCISIRLPWRRAPIYFCIPKESFQYQNKCKNKFASNCGNPRNDTLMIATPWECCPLMSYPDSCVHHQCPPPPYERKCQEVAPDSGRQECCPSYFCEEDITPDLCHFRLLEPGCHSPPQNKKNCVGFKDSHGCCPKWQCEGDTDTKPGECPMEAMARKSMAAYTPTNKTGIIDAPPPPAFHEENAFAANGAEAIKSGFKASSNSFIPNPFRHHTKPREACVGDFNCPGEMKCCSDDMRVYISDGHYLDMKKNRDPTSGWCTQPEKKDSKDRKTEDDSY